MKNQKDKIIYFLIFTSLSFTNLLSQDFNNKFVFKNKYLKYLLINDSTSHSSLVNIDFSYLYMPKSGTFVTQGTNWNLGVNLARFFTKKIILGISYNLKVFNGIYNQRFSNDFIEDFNSNFNTIYKDENDSLLNYTLKGIINQNIGYKVFGNTFDDIGLEFSPFPDKYGAILLEVKNGTRIYRLSSPNSQISDTHDGFIYLNLKNCITFNLKFKPYNFFNNDKIMLKGQRIRDFYKFLIVGLYCERLNWNNATVLNKQVNQIVAKPFIDKYSNVNNFGIKLGIGLY